MATCGDGSYSNKHSFLQPDWHLLLLTVRLADLEHWYQSIRHSVPLTGTAYSDIAQGYPDGGWSQAKWQSQPRPTGSSCCYVSPNTDGEATTTTVLNNSNDFNNDSKQ